MNEVVLHAGLIHGQHVGRDPVAQAVSAEGSQRDAGKAGEGRDKQEGSVHAA